MQILIIKNYWQPENVKLLLSIVRASETILLKICYENNLATLKY